MKRTLIALLLVGSSSALFAQAVTGSTTNDNTTNSNTNTSTINSNTNTTPNTSTTTDVNSTVTDNSTSTSVSNSSYNAYGTTAVDVPSTVRYSFTREYPTVTNAQWYQTPNGQWRVMYKDNMNQDMDVYYYGTSAQSYKVSLPVRESLTPEDVITKIKSMYGMSIYDVNRVKAANNEYVYHVRVLDNGQVRSEWVNEQGNTVAATDVFRTADVANNDIINEVNTTTTDSNAAMSTTTDQSTNTNTKTKMKMSDGTKIKSKNGEVRVK